MSVSQTFHKYLHIFSKPYVLIALQIYTHLFVWELNEEKTKFICDFMPMGGRIINAVKALPPSVFQVSLLMEKEAPTPSTEPLHC